VTHDAWRKAVLARDGDCCTQCKSTVRLQADHILPVSMFPHLMREVVNGRTLCFECHKKTDTFGGKQMKGRRQERNPYGTR
jgi:5-methylcytosine-specific restriction endonuclease McrA